MIRQPLALILAGLAAASSAHAAKPKTAPTGSAAGAAASAIEQGGKGSVDSKSASFYGLGSLEAKNPVAVELMADWKKAGLKSADTNQWVQMFLRGEYEGYAHLWSTLSEKTPAKLETASRAAYPYSLKELGIPQTFFDQWMLAMQSPTFASSKASRALTEALTPGFEAWFTQGGVRISPAQTGAIHANVKQGGPFLSLQAHLMLRKGLQGLELLKKLPKDSVYQARLSQSAMVAYVRQGDLANAAKVLKNHYEPYLELQKDPERLSAHYLSIARLLYQAGSLEGAIQFYEKIPTSSPEFLTAREELSWCWLRTGNQEKLRGSLETLTSKVLENEFQPEAYVVRAVSNLKNCYYGEVEKDFKTFLAANQTWATRIDANQKKAETDTPRRLDQFGQVAARMVDAREKEVARLKELSERSISAVVPAVGIQKHWKQALQTANNQLAEARKIRADEFRRQWKNDRVALNEAIRKMQFVKVELLSQLAMANAEAAEAKTDEVKVESATAKRWESEGDMVFPFDGVVWPDELFKLRSVAQGRCIGQEAKK